MNSPLQTLSDAGVSIWLDDLSRARLTSGNLAQKIEKDSVTGVTSYTFTDPNPPSPRAFYMIVDATP